MLGMHGPCMTYDTACSSALSACHAGLRALQLGECEIGVVSGVSMMLTPAVSISFAVAGMTSARGSCHTFDARADGYARGEACGSVSLFPGGDARALRVCGSAVRQDGRSASLTAPNGQAQQALLLAALGDAGTASDELSLNEAHGTGTALGDPIETGSLVGAVLTERDAPLAVSGIKANIGHAEPAAGMTGLLKLALGLQEGEAVPNAKLRSLNPHVGALLRGLACTLPVQLAATKVTTNIGGVSSFGFNGSIVHTVISVDQCAPETAEGGACALAASTLPPLMYHRHSFPWQTAPRLAHRPSPAATNTTVPVSTRVSTSVSTSGPTSADGSAQVTEQIWRERLALAAQLAAQANPQVRRTSFHLTPPRRSSRPTPSHTNRQPELTHLLPISPSSPIPTQPNPTQPNPTQTNSTQTNPTRPDPTPP